LGEILVATSSPSAENLCAQPAPRLGNLCV